MENITYLMVSMISRLLVGQKNEDQRIMTVSYSGQSLKAANDKIHIYYNIR